MCKKKKKKKILLPMWKIYCTVKFISNGLTHSIFLRKISTPSVLMCYQILALHRGVVNLKLLNMQIHFKITLPLWILNGVAQIL